MISAVRPLSSVDLEATRRKISHGRLYRACVFSLCLCLTFWLVTPNPFVRLWIPAPLQPLLFRGYIIHFSVYFLLTTLLLPLCDRSRLHLRLCVALLAAHAFMTETSQIWTPTRTWDLGDLACNLTGIAAGWLVYCHWSKARTVAERPRPRMLSMSLQRTAIGRR